MNQFVLFFQTKEVQLDENSAQLLLQTNEIETLRKQLVDAQGECAKIQDLESKNKEYQKQCQMHDETFATLQSDLIAKNVLIAKIQKDLEKLNITCGDAETIDLNVENVLDKVMRNPDNWKILRDVIGRCGDEMNMSCLLCQKTIDLSANEREADLVHQTEEVLSSVSAEWKAQCDQLATANTELQTTNDMLSAENARLQVDISTFTSQVTSLNAQHVAIQLANSQLATEKDTLTKQKEAIESQHKSLLADQKQMQSLHEQLSAEYESLNEEHKKLKDSMRDVRHDNRNLQEQEENLKRQINELQTKYDNMSKENETYSNLRSEHSKLKDDFRSLFTTSERFKREYKSIQVRLLLISIFFF